MKAEPKDGTVIYVAPIGSRGDGESKIYPFKLHKTRVPFDPEAGKPIPIKVGVVFATGDVESAIRLGAEAVGLGFRGEFVTLVRYMSVNHGVQPKEYTLRCIDCHFSFERMPWTKLGYHELPAIYAATYAGFVEGVALLAYSFAARRSR